MQQFAQNGQFHPCIKHLAVVDKHLMPTQRGICRPTAKQIGGHPVVPLQRPRKTIPKKTPVQTHIGRSCLFPAQLRIGRALHRQGREGGHPRIQSRAHHEHGVSPARHVPLIPYEPRSTSRSSHPRAFRAKSSSLICQLAPTDHSGFHCTSRDVPHRFD